MRSRSRRPGSASTAEDRRAVLGGVFDSTKYAQIAPLTAWIDTQNASGAKLAGEAAILLAATDRPAADDSHDALDHAQFREAMAEQLALAVYRHADGELPDYDAYMAHLQAKKDPDAMTRYYQDVTDQDTPVADRLLEYAATITTGR